MTLKPHRGEGKGSPLGGGCQSFMEEAGIRGASGDVEGSFPPGETEQGLGTGRGGGSNTRRRQASGGEAGVEPGTVRL